MMEDQKRSRGSKHSPENEGPNVKAGKCRTENATKMQTFGRAISATAFSCPVFSVPAFLCQSIWSYIFRS